MPQKYSSRLKLLGVISLCLTSSRVQVGTDLLGHRSAATASQDRASETGYSVRHRYFAETKNIRL